SDGNGSHASTLKSPSYTKSVSWQHYQRRHGSSEQMSPTEYENQYYQRLGSV
ncbi:transposase, partial [Escherichia coli]